MALVSPGVEVTIIDQSQYLPAASSSVPFIMLATAQDKADPNSTTGAVAAGTTAANAGKLYQVTSQRDLVSLFGNPFFYKTTAGTSIQGYELNEYGLLAAYSTLGVTNRAFVMRADVDLASLIGQVGRPLGDPANGTYWLDTTNSKWGIFEFDAVSNRFVNKLPIVVTETNQIDVSTGAPLSSVGVIGDYAINQTSLYHSLTSREYPGAWYKNLDNEWVQVGSLAWRASWPTARGSTAQTVVGGNITINLSTNSSTTAEFSFAITQGQALGGVIAAINSATSAITGTPQILRAAFADNLNSRINLYSAQNTDDATITLGGDTNTWASLGFVVPQGGTTTYYQPKALWASNANQPRWRSTDAQPRPTGSVYFKTTAANDGASLVVSQYNAVSDTWTASPAPYYGNDAAAIGSLDSQGGLNIPAGSLYTNYAFDGTLEQYGVQLFRRVASGPAVFTGVNASTVSFRPGETVSISYTVPGQSAYSATVDVTIPANGTGYSNFQAALSAATANAPYIVSSVDTNGNVVLQHTQGGTIRMTDALSRGIESVSISNGGNFTTSLVNVNFTSTQYSTTASGVASIPATLQPVFSSTISSAIVTKLDPFANVFNAGLGNANTVTIPLTVLGGGNGSGASANAVLINTGDRSDPLNDPVWSVSTVIVGNGGSNYTGPVTFQATIENNSVVVATAVLRYSVANMNIVNSGTGYITANTSISGNLTANVAFSAVAANTVSANILGVTSYLSTSQGTLPTDANLNIPITFGSSNTLATITGTVTTDNSFTVDSVLPNGFDIDITASAIGANVIPGTIVNINNAAGNPIFPVGTYVASRSGVDITVTLPSGFTNGNIINNIQQDDIFTVTGYFTNILLTQATPATGNALQTVGSNASVSSTTLSNGITSKLGFTPAQNASAKDSSILQVNYTGVSGATGTATFNVTAFDSYYGNVTVVNPGTGYTVGTVINIPAASVNAVSTDPLVLQVTGVSGGAITSVIVLSGTPVQQKYYELSNWYRLGYTANEGAPAVNPTNGTPWFYSVIDEVDIMINDADPGSPANWKGYRNVDMDVRGFNLTNTDPNGPIIAAAAPTVQSDSTPLVYGDLWIDTSDLENYPQIYRWENVEARDQWVLINSADQATQNGIVFADARWGAAGTVDPVNDPIPTIQSLLVSNYLDLDAPDAAVYPQGMLLWNLRRSGYNIKEFRTNYFNSESFPDQVLPQYTYTWVSTSGLRSDGSPYMGRKAQRAQVVAAMRAALDTNMTVREEDTFFNLMSAPNYPELQPNMVALNNERNNTAYIIGDTPLRLRDDANDIVAWATNAANATSTGEDGLVTRDAYMGLYYPAGITTDLTGSEVVVPASHMMLRTMLRNDTVAYPWFAPAGTRRGTIDNANNIGYLDAQSGEFQVIKNRMRIRDVLYENQINPLAFFTGVGLVNYGNKNSQETFSALNRTNVSRLVAYLRERLSVLAKPYVFEFNDSLTRGEIRNACQTLLADILSKRGLYDYLVVCDTTNNTPARIDRNELWVDIAIEPAKAAEFIYIPVRILNTGEIAGVGQNG